MCIYYFVADTGSLKMSSINQMSDAAVDDQISSTTQEWLSDSVTAETVKSTTKKPLGSSLTTFVQEMFNDSRG